MNENRVEKITDINWYKKKAIEVRRDILLILEQAGSGHTGGSLSIVEILLALYFYKMRHNPEDPEWRDRDRFVLSKGHGCPALYTILSHLNYFPQEELLTLRKLGSRLQGHPHRGLPGIEISSGSLGQGLSVANGMALAANLDKRDYRIYCLIGDGECDEGQIWEAAMTSAHYKLDNVCVLLDRNGYQIDGNTHDIKNLEPLDKKWESFGWCVITVDGHDVEQLMKALDKAGTVKNKPTILIAHTIKGKGISFMENDNKWHGVVPSQTELERALKELEINRCH